MVVIVDLFVVDGMMRHVSPAIFSFGHPSSGAVIGTIDNI